MPTPPYIADLRAKVGHALLFVPTVTVIARDDRDRLLLVHDRDARQWTLPGGIVEPDETPADAAVREVWEETGARIALTRLLGVVGGPGCRGRYRNGDQLGWVSSVFGARVPADCHFEADGAEIVEARLWHASELDGLEVSTHVARFLRAEAGAADGAYFEPPQWCPPD
ncbi:NUDIX domain-containing protein [Cognatilysobacter segetis]|uniref:NUDIX domain-containing protein n=1 Tax=Cognatilysobacter segetis TaxID=2492394 RepID=UPI001390242C|nr:NUDIX domain-containing protein [Lysobacter segetis]